MEQKWEQKERITEILKKHEGLTEEDIAFFWQYADANGMPVHDDMLPIFATALVMRRDGKNITAEMQEIRAETKSLTADFKEKQAQFLAALKEAFALEKTAIADRIKMEDELTRQRVDELNEWGVRQRELAATELQTVSKEMVGKAIEGASVELQQQVEKIANGVSQAVIDTHSEAKAIELRKIDALHKRSQTIILVFSGLLIAIAIIVTAVLTHVYTRESTLVHANELVQYAKAPNAAGYLEWMRLYDENSAVILRTCGAAGSELVQNSALCTPTIRIAKSVPRFFDGVPIADTIEAWWLTRSSWTSGFIGGLTTLLVLIGAPHLWNCRWLVWIRRNLSWLRKPE